jgi:hypothetical protein
MNELLWTRTQPTEAGWYWLRYIRGDPFNDKSEIVKVREYVGELCIVNWAIPDKNVMWAGPISKPKNRLKIERRKKK